MITPNNNEQLKEKFVSYIRDIYAMEDRFNNTLEQYGEQLKNFKDFPEFRSRLYKHLEMTREHTAHIGSRLQFYKVQPPTIENTFTPYTSPLLSYFPMVKPTTWFSLASTWFTMEQFKIASYRCLSTLAQAYGDNDTLRFAEEHLREDIDMQNWIFGKLPEVCLYTLQFENVSVPPSAWEFVKQLEPVGTTPSFPIPR